ncbi:hypothetical protein F906_01891 [Acinetobacter pseudolwoffii]|uniref:Uncharacterized protein n=1 Tax=Acinetobacter pseudolwoffii TaxID=2053287 RepID=N9M8Z1_9GAMM|nr:anti-phage protein KwaA [Acinetobacter pseudolwoffii]ENW86819.1 hypothetical protein F906_01891 [Acinetobacter pseudolwoffii]
MLKVHLYILSLALLFIFFIILNAPYCFGVDCRFVGFKEISENNVISIVSVLVLFWCAYGYWCFKHKLKGTSEIPFKIKKIESANYEHVTFLATYVIPLISFDFNKERQMIVLLLLLGCVLIWLCTK